MSAITHLKNFLDAQVIRYKEGSNADFMAGYGLIVGDWYVQESEEESCMFYADYRDGEEDDEEPEIYLLHNIEEVSNLISKPR
jgi:hypothetical protein